MEKNKVKIIKCNSKNLRKTLLPLLIGRVFHVTDVKGYEGIKELGKIRHNRNGEFPFTFGQSKVSYGRLRGYICLFDFRNFPGWDWGLARPKTLLNPPKYNNKPIYLILSEGVYPKIVPWTKAKKEDAYKEMWVPYVECWHPGDITIDKIADVFNVTVKPDPNSLAERLRRAESRLSRYSSGKEDNLPLK